MEKEALKGKVAIITGASSGIGKMTAIALAKQGVNVVLAARNQDALVKLTEALQPYEVNTLAIPTDVTQKEQVKELIQKTLKYMKKVDFFIANAGQYLRRPVTHLKTNVIEEVMAVNFYGVFHGIHEVLPLMLSQKSGHIVVVSSVDGKKGIPPDAAYVASKFALTGFIEVLRQELYNTNVNVTTVFPGRIDTPMIEKLNVPRISAKIPPEKVADAIVSAIKTRKAEVLIPYFSSKLLILLNSISYRLGDWAVRTFELSGKTMKP